MKDPPKERSSGEGDGVGTADAAAAEVIRPTAASHSSPSSSAGRRLATAPLDEEPDATRPRWNFREVFSSCRSTGRLGGSLEPPATSTVGAGPEKPDWLATCLAGAEADSATPPDWFARESSAVREPRPAPAPAPAPGSAPAAAQPRAVSLSAAFGLALPVELRPRRTTASVDGLAESETVELGDSGNQDQQSSEPGAANPPPSPSGRLPRSVAADDEAPTKGPESDDPRQSSPSLVATHGDNRATGVTKLEDMSDEDAIDSDEEWGGNPGRFQGERGSGRVHLRPNSPDERDRAARREHRSRRARHPAAWRFLDNSDDSLGPFADHFDSWRRSAFRHEYLRRSARLSMRDGPHAPPGDAAPSARDRQGELARSPFNDGGPEDGSPIPTGSTWERTGGPWHRGAQGADARPGLMGPPSGADGADGSHALPSWGTGDEGGSAGGSSLSLAHASAVVGGAEPTEASGDGRAGNAVKSEMGVSEGPGESHPRPRPLASRHEAQDGLGRGRSTGGSGAARTDTIGDGRAGNEFRRRMWSMEGRPSGATHSSLSPRPTRHREHDGVDVSSAGTVRSALMDTSGDNTAGDLVPFRVGEQGGARGAAPPPQPPLPPRRHRLRRFGERRSWGRDRLDTGGAGDDLTPDEGLGGPAGGNLPLPSSQALQRPGRQDRLDAGGEGSTGGRAGPDGGYGGHEDVQGQGQGTEEGDSLFPEEILFQIFTLLDLRALGRVAQVCQQWCRMSGQPEFWRHVDLRGCAIRLNTFADLCERQDQIQSLNLVGCPFSSDELERLGPWALVHLSRLRELSLGQCRFPNSLVTGLATHCPTLQVLRVSDATSGYERLSISHPQLVELELSGCTLGAVILQCPALQSFSLRGSQAYSVELTCPQLRTLDLSRCGKLTEGSLQRAVVSCTRLTSLNLAGCSGINDDTLWAVGQQCTQLTSLDASDCPNVTLDHMATWPSLVTLTLRHCSGLSTSSLRMLSRCPQLTMLHLDSSQPLTVANVELDSLTELSLSNCARLAGVAVRCPYLERIDLGSCPALRTVEVTSLSLAAFALRSQMYLTSVKLDCPALRQLDLSDCPSLSDALFESLAEPASCRNLADLRLENCEGLTNVVVRADRLDSISFSGCSGIKSLKLQCSSLTSLSLEGCEYLETAEVAHVLLTSLNLGICPRLSTLTLTSTSLGSLELRGCGALATVHLACPNLGTLDASYCSNLSDTCLAQLPTTCPQLSSLVLAACPGITGEGLASLGPLQHLASLDLSYTFLTTLAPIFESCSHLRVLKLSACKLLTAEALFPLSSSSQAQGSTGTCSDGGSSAAAALAELTDLDVSYTSLDSKAAEFLLMHCPRLQSISLSGCLKVSDSIWACLSQPPFSDPSGAKEGSAPVRMLRSLSLVGCTKLTCAKLPSSAAVPYLTSLNLTWAKNVASVDVACPTLLSLNLSNCESLVEIKLQCPRLTSLLLQGCLLSPDALMAALASCTSLETLDVRRHCAQVGSETINLIRSHAPHLRRTYT